MCPLPPVLLTYIRRAVRQLLIKESSSYCQQHGRGEHVGWASGYLHTSVHQLWKGHPWKFQDLVCSATIATSFTFFNEHSLLNRLSRSSPTPCQCGYRRASKGINRNQDLPWALQWISIQFWPSYLEAVALKGWLLCLLKCIFRIALGWFTG